MSKIKQNTPWSTVLKPSATMPDMFKRRQRLGIFLGWTKDRRLVRVVSFGNATAAAYTPEFWEVDESYMSAREKIAELMGRIAESNEPSDIRDYRAEIENIKEEAKL